MVRRPGFSYVLLVSIASVVMVTFGAIIREDETEAAARLVEVTRDTPPVEVWDLHIFDNSPTGASIVFRAERLPSLYP